MRKKKKKGIKEQKRKKNQEEKKNERKVWLLSRRKDKTGDNCMLENYFIHIYIYIR